jgi:hypothetical protein
MDPRSRVCRWIAAALTVCALAPLWAYRPRQAPTAFRVAAQAGASVLLLVPPDTTDAALAELVAAIRDAREKGTLSTLIPGTAPRGGRSAGDAVEVFVMSDAAWATPARLRDFVHPPGTAMSAEAREFQRRVLAYYLHSLSGHDEGTLGYPARSAGPGRAVRKLF